MQKTRKVKIPNSPNSNHLFSGLDPWIDKYVDGSLNKLITYFQLNNGLKSIWKIEKAYHFAKDKHEGQLRKDGKTPYFMHVLKVATELSKRGYNSKVIEAALLHDVIEDCNVSLKDIRKLFGVKVARIVDLLSKPKLVCGKWTFSNNKNYYFEDEYRIEKYEERAKEYYERLLGSKNIDAIVVKLFDSIANLEDIRNLEPEKINRNIERMIKYVLWLSPAILCRPDYIKIIDNLSEWNYNIPEELLPKNSTESIVVLPPRESINLDFLRKMPSLSQNSITLYWSDELQFFEIGFPGKFAGKYDKIRVLLKKYFDKSSIRKKSSLVAKGIGAYEIIFEIEKKDSFKDIFLKCEKLYSQIS